MGQMNLHKLITIAVIVVLKVVNVTSNYPDETGGYSIVVAFEETIPEPVNDGATSLLIENVKTTIGTFSEKLWNASRHQFYVKSVDILIPSSWNGVNSTLSIKYDTAAIRVSSADRVYVDNPFTCGKPGNFIELPVTFFSDSDSGRYGLNWKALLNLWATYRWGVYEEHGYIGNSKYPYSHLDLLTDEWEVTGCSNQQITGVYTDNESLPCAASDTLEPESSCRFVPDQTTNATTSIMHFHWIDSIVSFCDESNHNKLSPNRHNALCDHKSAWEVISITRDYQLATNPMNVTIPPVAFKIVQHSKKPSLYILLDRGRIQGSVGVANQVPREIINFLGDTGRYDTVAAVGTYPTNDDEMPISDEIDWSTLGENFDKFVDVIGTLRFNGPLQRNFPGSILAAANKINVDSHPNGVVMLVIKYGADLSSFGNYPPESEVLHALNVKGIILNAIELHVANHSGHAHLSELAQKTGGVYTVLSNYEDAQPSMSNVLWFLSKLLNENYKELRKNYRNLLKTTVTPGSVIRFKVPRVVDLQTNAGKVEAVFSTMDGSLSINDFTIQGVASTSDPGTVVIDNIVFRKRQDWLESGSKWTYVLHFGMDKIAPYSEVSIRTICASCSGTMLIRSDLVDADDVAQNVTISVFSNVESNAIDLSANEPIVIFVKVTNSTSSVTGAQVMVFITEVGAPTVYSIRLTDNGDGSPDEASSDGTYSGYFVPSKDGNYDISISVQGQDEDASLSLREESTVLEFPSVSTHGHSRLLPVDQDMGCNGAYCKTEALTGDFMQFVDIFANLEISGTANYSPEPAKIDRFIVSPDAGAETVMLLWLAPIVPGMPFSVSSYDIRQSRDKENLIIDFQNQEAVPGVSSMTPGAPGSIEILNIAKPTDTTFYAIRSVYRGRQSKISEVQAIQIKEDVSTTPATTDTSTDDTTSSTSPTIDTSTDAELISSSTTSWETTAETETSRVSPSSSESPSFPTSDDDTEATSMFPTTGGTEISSVIPSSSPSTTAPTKKPWAKTGGGIAVITVITLIVVSAIIFIVYYLLKTRGSSTAKINPPPNKPRSSLLL